MAGERPIPFVRGADHPDYYWNENYTLALPTTTGREVMVLLPGKDCVLDEICVRYQAGSTGVIRFQKVAPGVDASTGGVNLDLAGMTLSTSENFKVRDVPLSLTENIIAAHSIIQVVKSGTMGTPTEVVIRMRLRTRTK